MNKVFIQHTLALPKCERRKVLERTKKTKKGISTAHDTCIRYVMSYRKRTNDWLINVIIISSILIIIASHCFCGNNDSDDPIYNISSTSPTSNNNLYCSAFQIQNALRKRQRQVQGEQFNFINHRHH